LGFSAYATHNVAGVKKKGYKLNNSIFRLARESELAIAWAIVQDAIEQRRRDGSQQWQNGYPNEQTIKNDIAAGNGYVLVEDEEILAYAAVIFGVEPAYLEIEGAWLTSGSYAVVHRVARASVSKGKGIATRLFEHVETLSLEKGVNSIRIDTNFDNAPMLHIVDKLNYVYCGEIYYAGAPRKAYEKVLVK
jgi:GNAT superfamily N-acetyltransferase